MQLCTHHTALNRPSEKTLHRCRCSVCRLQPPPKLLQLCYCRPLLQLRNTTEQHTIFRLAFGANSPAYLPQNDLEPNWVSEQHPDAIASCRGSCAQLAQYRVYCTCCICLTSLQQAATLSNVFQAQPCMPGSYPIKRIPTFNHVCQAATLTHAFRAPLDYTDRIRVCQAATLPRCIFQDPSSQ